jgi:DNA-binding NarL/FixJ family response regulator
LHRLVIVDPHPIVREGIGRLAAGFGGLEVVGSAAEASEAKRVLTSAGATAAVVAVDGAHTEGLSLLRWIASHCPSVRVLALAGPGVPQMHEAIQAGALGIVPKHATTEAIAEALRDVVAGRPHYPHTEERRPFELTQNAPRPGLPSDLLSLRELEVFENLGAGRTAREVALALGLSVKTIASHRANIQAKLGIKNLAEFLRCAVLWREHQARGGLPLSRTLPRVWPEFAKDPAAES